MKLADIARAQPLIERFNTFETQLKTIRENPIRLMCEKLDIEVTAAFREKLRSDIISSIVIEQAKLREQLVELGVDL